jgi:hypothetical protein
MKAPSMPAATASQVRPETFSLITGNAGDAAGVVEGLLMET